MKRYITILITLALLLTLAACAATPVEVEMTAPVMEGAPVETEAPTPVEAALPAQTYTPPTQPQPFPGKIAIISDFVTYSEEEYRSARYIVEKYGEDKIVHKVWPAKFPEEGEMMIRIVQQIAIDPEIKVLIINQTVQNSLAAVDKLLETRDDIFLVAIQPEENPADILQKFNLVLSTDDISMGDSIPVQAQKLGAKTFVHLSFPRHMSYVLISTRHKLLEENCEKLGIEFVSHTVPDPTGDIGVAGARQVIMEEIPKLVAQYGQDTAFFCTNCGLQAPLIKAVADAGAIYVQPYYPSPFQGFPLEIDLFDGTIWHMDTLIVQEIIDYMVYLITEKLAEKNMLGRVSAWPISMAVLNTVAAAEYAVKLLNGEVPKEGLDMAVLKQCMFDYVDMGVEYHIRTLGSHEADVNVAVGKFLNWLLVSEDFITFGE